MNNRWLGYVVFPAVLFLLILFCLAGFQMLISVTQWVEAILYGLARYVTHKFPGDVATLFANPVRAIAIPIAFGLLFMFFYFCISDFIKNYNDNLEGFVRGRSLEDRSQSRGRSRSSSRPSSREKSSTRPSQLPSGRPSEQRDAPNPSVRPNRRRRDS